MSYCERCGEDSDVREQCRECNLEMCGDCMTEEEFQAECCRVCLHSDPNEEHRQTAKDVL